jgi:FG-GAP repeat
VKLPAGLRVAIHNARQADVGLAYRFGAATSGVVAARNAIHHVDVALARGELDVTAADGAGWHLGLRWTGIGRGSAVAAVQAPVGEPSVADSRGSYVRADGSEEWYENGPQGVEQGFNLTARPAGDPGEAVAIEVSATGDLTPALDGAEGVSLRDAQGVTQARYTDLTAVDAGGATLKSWIEVEGHVVRLLIDDAGARYPLHVDPLVWTQKAELIGSDAALDDEDGFSVALDGSTALVGAPTNNLDQGAAYVFTQSGGVWTQQAKLVASDGLSTDEFGYAVALQGTTAVIGAPFATTSVAEAGLVYVFTQSGGVWTQATELSQTAPTGSDRFGISVALSGTTAVVGAPGHRIGLNNGAGAAYVLTGSGSSWTGFPAISAADGAASDQFGTAVALSGTTLAVSSPLHSTSGIQGGAVYVYNGSGGSYTLTAELTAKNPGNGDELGYNIALSSNLLVAGAPARSVLGLASGSAVVFAQSGGVWAQQAELSPSAGGSGDDFGLDVALSGYTVLIGAPAHEVGALLSQGEAYVFTQTDGVWSQSSTITAADGAADNYFGYSVALQGTNALIGAPGHNLLTGAAYVFVSPGCTGGYDAAGNALGPVAEGTAVCGGGYHGWYCDFNGIWDEMTTMCSNVGPAPLPPSVYCSGGDDASGRNLYFTAAGTTICGGGYKTWLCNASGSWVYEGASCTTASCSNGILDPGEDQTDCGGSCLCASGQDCTTGANCKSGICTNSVCN